MNGYEFNKIAIPINDITSYKINQKLARTYHLGGFYLIEDNVLHKAYVGKSQQLMSRLKSHLYNAIRDRGLSIDRAMHGRLSDFSFYSLAWYQDLGINFFTRDMESKIEHMLIGMLNTKHPLGYNMVHYERI